MEGVPLNTAPVLASQPDRFDTVGDVANLIAVASDAEGHLLSFAATGLPDGLSMNSSGVVAGALLVAGVYPLSVTVTDSAGAADSINFTWTVLPDVGCADCVDFAITPTQAYADQDVDGNAQAANNGGTLVLADNTWRRSAQRYQVTPNSILQFDFASSAEGEVHGIGLEQDNVPNSDRIFQLYGQQVWGLQAFNDYSGPGYKHYEIPVGNYFTGTDFFLVFVNDNDAGGGNTGFFRNVRVYESTANGSPTLSPIAEQRGLEGAAVSMSVLASDPDNDVLSYAANGLPSGLFIDPVDRRDQRCVGHQCA